MVWPHFQFIWAICMLSLNAFLCFKNSYFPECVRVFLCLLSKELVPLGAADYSPTALIQRHNHNYHYNEGVSYFRPEKNKNMKYSVPVIYYSTYTTNKPTRFTLKQA